MRLVLFQPDIPQNSGTMMRLCSALGIGCDIIEPCGFILDDRRLRRAGMDYLDHLDLQRFSGWQEFCRQRPGRKVLLTTQADCSYCDFTFEPDDLLIVGRESAGAPPEIHNASAARIGIPMQPQARSLNVATAASMVLGEALRQTGGFFEHTA